MEKGGPNTHQFVGAHWSGSMHSWYGYQSQVQTSSTTDQSLPPHSSNIIQPPLDHKRGREKRRSYYTHPSSSVTNVTSALLFFIRHPSPSVKNRQRKERERRRKRASYIRRTIKEVNHGEYSTIMSIIFLYYIWTIFFTM